MCSAQQLEIHLRDNYQGTNDELNTAFHTIFNKYIATLDGDYKKTFETKQNSLERNGGPFYSYRSNKRSR